MADGFLGRWSRRKLDARDGRPPDESAEVPAPASAPAPASSPGASSPGASSRFVAGVATAAPARPVTGAASPSGPRGESAAGHVAVQTAEPLPEPPPPTLVDAHALGRDADFRPFMARNVAPEVKNAAMRKLFSDPHFNVMDRLDTYIDDYSLPDPIPAAMLRQMNGARMLGLFDDEDAAKDASTVAVRDARSAENEAAADKDPTQRSLGDDADGEPAEAVAQSHATPENLPAPAHGSQPASPPAGRASQDQDAHTDLRLQPDDAAQAPGPGRGAA